MLQIRKLYVSNFLMGLVFWYGIEKLFMRSIGIDAVGIGFVSAMLLVTALIFDIPAGIVADKWSRKGVLIVSAIFLAISSVLLGMSHGLFLYALGYMCYGLYMVTTSGTYHALTYDILHEQGRAEDYSKIAGRAFAIFLVGAGVANVASGFIASHFDYRTNFFVTVISCALNIVVISTIREPKFHKTEQKEKMLRQLKEASTTIARIKLLRILAIIMSSFAIVDLFSTEFGQLYILRYLSAPQLLGLVWSGYSFSWAFGSFIAHRLRARLDGLVLLTTLPLIAMSLIDKWFSLVLFMLQISAIAALANQIETRIQENTRSQVRASVLSVLSTLRTIVLIPATLLVGWLIRDHNVFFTLRAVTVVASLTLLYWLWSSRNIPKALQPVVAETPPTKGIL